MYPYPENLAIVSKVGGRRDAAGAGCLVEDPADLRADIENNLRSLGIEQLAAAVSLQIDGQRLDALFDDQLAVMIAARDAGLIGGIGLSSIDIGHLLHATASTDIVCVQNPYNLVDRSSQPVLDECVARGIAFVPFFPLDLAFAQDNPVLGNAVMRRAAADLGLTPRKSRRPGRWALHPMCC